MHHADFIAAMAATKVEEEVKHEFTKLFKFKLDASDYVDLYTSQIIFEFKFDKNLKAVKVRAALLAQSLYYIRRLRFGEDTRAIAPTIALVDKNEAILTETNLWRAFYNDDAYDWERAPSQPDEKLVNALTEHAALQQMHVYDLTQAITFGMFVDELTRLRDPQMTLGTLGDKKVITLENFEKVFAEWDSCFHKSVENGFRASRYFVADIQHGKSHFLREEGKVVFEFGGSDSRTKKITPSEYEFFWRKYEKVTNNKTIEDILARIDRLTDPTLRQFEGEFFTPLEFSRLGLEYLEKTLGKNWTSEYKIWDMAAGTGNLEYLLPSTFHDENLFLSTLDAGEVEHLRRLFPWAQANCFQYDYLNDDVDLVFASEEQKQLGAVFDRAWKMPEKLRKALANPKNKWVVLINPPFATSGNHIGLGNKTSVNKTGVREKMHQVGLGNSSQELFSQFIFRIKQEIPNVTLGMFSTLKYVNSPANEEFRDKFFRFGFQRGFVFSAENFHGTKGKFPVGFLVWNLNREQDLHTQNIELDIFEKLSLGKELPPAEKIGKKRFVASDNKNLLNKWIKRPRSDGNTFAPLSSAVNQYEGVVRVDRLSRDAFGYMRSTANDLQNQNYVFFLSTAYGHGDGWSITSENFEQSFVVHAVRRIPKATWLNDRDQFRAPVGELPSEFVNDCVVWSLFSGSNQSSALKDVKYKEKLYQIKNEFYPFPVVEVRRWPCVDRDFSPSPTEGDRFVATWLINRELSAEAAEVLRLGRELYKLFYAQVGHIRTPEFKIASWDLGWWQLRMALADAHFGAELFAQMKIAHAKLKAKIEPQIYGLGFLAS